MQTILVSELSEEKIPKKAPCAPFRILILRTATREFSAVLGKLKEEFPESHITVMAPFALHETLKQDPTIDDLLTGPESGRWSLSNPGPSGLAPIKKGQFDLAVALYNEPRGQGYSNIDALAAKSGAREVRGYGPDSCYSQVTATTIRKKYLKERLAVFWLIANALTSVLLMGVVTLALVGEAFFRKLRGLWRTS